MTSSVTLTNESGGFRLHGKATRLCSFAKKWQKEEDKREADNSHTKRWQKRTEQGYKSFAGELEKQVEKENLSDEATQKMDLLIGKVERSGFHVN